MEIDKECTHTHRRRRRKRIGSGGGRQDRSTHPHYPKKKKDATLDNIIHPWQLGGRPPRRLVVAIGCVMVVCVLWIMLVVVVVVSHSVG